MIGTAVAVAAVVIVALEVAFPRGPHPTTLLAPTTHAPDRGLSAGQATAVTAEGAPAESAAMADGRSAGRSGHLEAVAAAVPPNAVSTLAGESITVPQTYRVDVTVLGWQATSVACLRIESAHFYPEVSSRDGSPLTGTGAVTALSDRLVGLAVLASVPSRLSGLRVGGRYTARLILLPTTAGATFVLDRVAE